MGQEPGQQGSSKQQPEVVCALHGPSAISVLPFGQARRARVVTWWLASRAVANLEIPVVESKIWICRGGAPGHPLERNSSLPGRHKGERLGTFMIQLLENMPG